MSDDMDEAAILDRYREAFRRANGEEPPGIVHWGNGWYKVDGRSPKRRLKEFVEWAERMERRPPLTHP